MTGDDKTEGSRSRRRRRRTRTWSELGDLGRKPTVYEIVTHGMNHTMGETPLELGPDANGNEWLRTYRDDMAYQNVDWEGFRDPEQVTYETYCAMQDDAETHIDALLSRFDGDTDSDAEASDALVAYQRRVLTPGRYPAHGLQMLSAYVQQLAPSAYVANCASFQTADLVRRIQRIALRTKMLELAHPDAGFGRGERRTWEEDADWQPFRKAIEEALVVYRWDEALVVTQVMLKPVVDLLLLDRYAREVQHLGGELDSLLFANLAIDGARTRRWTTALVQHIIGSDEANLVPLRATVDAWSDRVEELVTAGARLVASGSGESAEEIADSVRSAHRDYLAEMGLALLEA